MRPCTHTCVYTDAPVAGGSKKPAVRKLRAKVDLDQEKGEVINKACYLFIYWGRWSVFP